MLWLVRYDIVLRKSIVEEMQRRLRAKFSLCIAPVRKVTSRNEIYLRVDFHEMRVSNLLKVTSLVAETLFSVYVQ